MGHSELAALMTRAVRRLMGERFALGKAPLFIRFGNGNFLQFGGLLAADAIARLKSFDVADLAEITNAIELAFPDRIEPLNFEGALGLHYAFHSDFPIR